MPVFTWVAIDKTWIRLNWTNLRSEVAMTGFPFSSHGKAKIVLKTCYTAKKRRCEETSPSRVLPSSFDWGNLRLHISVLIPDTMTTVFVAFFSYCRFRGAEFGLVTCPRQDSEWVLFRFLAMAKCLFSPDSKRVLMPTQSYNQRICGKGWRRLGGKAAGLGSWLPTFI